MPCRHITDLHRRLADLNALERLTQESKLGAMESMTTAATLGQEILISSRLVLRPHPDKSFEAFIISNKLGVTSKPRCVQ